jgi:hypothetical protein
MIAIGRIPAYLRVCGRQQAKLGASEIARADNHHHAALQIKKHR